MTEDRIKLQNKDLRYCNT